MDSIVVSQPKHNRSARLWQLGVVSLLTLGCALVNRHWLGVNVVTYGWDRMDHLITSLVYNDILASITPQSVFSALVFSNYYPPFVHLTVWLFYKLFGVNEDVAAMVNVIYLFVLLMATWSIAERISNRRTAMLAVIVLATCPIIFTMTRYLYLDFALTALVALAMALLLASEQFTRRSASLWFGLALGIAMLIKWTAAAFLVTPLVFVLWRSGVLADLVRHPAWLRPNGRRLALALATSVALTALWYIPSRAAAAQSPLGDWLFPGFTFLTTGLLYTLFSSIRAKPDANRPLANALGAGAVTLWTMAFWYLPNVEFLDGFWLNAYGLEGGGAAVYGEYLLAVITEHLGPIYSIVLVGVAIGFAWQGRTRLRLLFRQLNDTHWVLILWVITAYIIFPSRSGPPHSRYLMPFLPPLAIWIAQGLHQLQRPRLRGFVIGLVLLLATAQYALISFDSLAWARPAWQINLPVGRVNLLAHGFFIQYPSSELTDSHYALATTVLDQVEGARAEQQRERLNLGMLVNLPQLHEKHFLYPIYTTYHNITLRELARNWRDQPAYNQLFDMDFVLLSDTHTYGTSDTSRAVVERILTQPQDLFNLAFRPVQEWTLPGGELVRLYERRFMPTEPGFGPQNYETLLHEFGDDWGKGDALVLTAPDQAYIMGLSLPAESANAILPLPADGQSSGESLPALAQLIKTHERIFLLSHNAGVVDPEGAIEQWLRQNLVAGPDTWINALRVTPFITQPLPTTPTHAVTAQWEQGAELVGIAINEGTLSAQATLAVRLFWRAVGVTTHKVSLQLLAADGTLVVQQDATVADPQPPFVLLLPRTLAPGTYKLAAILYDPNTLAR
ncbi:MAG: glycosyltransferase family 39 protein, partial [Chloroflexota bacterium]|nr:glycosyltransferase family 39 protein [Chloroflexota bacterium]